MIFFCTAATHAWIPRVDVQLLLYFTFFNYSTTDWGTADDEEFPKNKEGKYFIYFTAKIKSERSL
jgi:hypothetical protein